jgi:diguanylate cyclase (GGDEF)-like protein
MGMKILHQELADRLSYSDRLLHEADELKHRSDVISMYNDLLVKMTANCIEWIFVVDADTKEIVYCNKSDMVSDDFLQLPCSKCTTHRHPGRDDILAWAGTSQETWQIHPKNGKYYQVHSSPVKWRDRNAYVHVVTDITEQYIEKNSLSNKAYFDPITSIYNRYFFEEYMEKIIADKKTVTLCYLDLDGLKFVNDNYGHSEGDKYIKSFAALIKQNFRCDDIFARIGGDEFCIVMDGCNCKFAEKKLDRIRTKLIAENTKIYPVSFSFGVAEINEGYSTLEEILKEADSRMYKQKKEYKKDRQ